jgi:hypothetical protein
MHTTMCMCYVTTTSKFNKIQYSMYSMMQSRITTSSAQILRSPLNLFYLSTSSFASKEPMCYHTSLFTVMLILEVECLCGTPSSLALSVEYQYQISSSDNSNQHGNVTHSIHHLIDYSENPKHHQIETCVIHDSKRQTLHTSSLV